MSDVAEIHPCEPVHLGIPCRWCGGELMAVGIVYRGITLQGFRELVYRHVRNGEEDCTVTYRARPYDGWQATAAFEKAQMTSSAAQGGSDG